jgi:hypothetical protein
MPHIIMRRTSTQPITMLAIAPADNPEEELDGGEQFQFVGVTPMQSYWIFCPTDNSDAHTLSALQMALDHFEPLPHLFFAIAKQKSPDCTV